MEGESNSRALALVDTQPGLLPALSTERSLQVLEQERRGLVKWVNWLVSHPVARLGTAAIALAAGVYLSHRKPRGFEIVPSRGLISQGKTAEWLITGVGLSVQSDCQQVSIWSISGFRSRR